LFREYTVEDAFNKIMDVHTWQKKNI
jgi:hypothetical protein